MDDIDNLPNVVPDRPDDVPGPDFLQWDVQRFLRILPKPFQLLMGSLDRVLFDIEEILDKLNELNLLFSITPVARPVLGRLEETELRLPVSKDVRP
jgi:hypothetical protein